ncbi:hypothetical protein MAR_035969 [Mya arenaria]|uniref:LRAT domain-containing protein n=1 Tax=Mya arenaria TaxID=6604 RepID=A0ABY7ELM8_MYAAR|nr:hypothetical protein MAR_035969 [Mya arenaria]
MQRQVKKRQSFCEEDYEDIIHDQTVLNAKHIGTNIGQLKPGDHIAWERSYIIWHHAIVESCYGDQTLYVIEFSKEGEVLKVHTTKIENRTEINGRLFRINYPEPVIIGNSPVVVLDRAHQMIKQHESYNLFSNNCEHLATYCKTGKRISYQVKWAQQKAVEVSASSATSEANLTKATQHVVRQLAATQLRQQLIAIAIGPQVAALPQFGQKIDALARLKQQIAAIPNLERQLAAIQLFGQQPAAIPQVGQQLSAIFSKLVNKIGIAATIVAEVWYIGKDIYKFAQQRDLEEISASHANQLITERISEGVIGVVASHYGGILGAKTGALLGVQIGSLAGPVGTAVGAVSGAVVGGFVGSFASTSVGKCIGNMIGRCLGRWCWW